MGSARKIESMLEVVCSECSAILRENLEAAVELVAEIESFSDIKGLFGVAAAQDGAILDSIVNAAALSDVFYVVCQSILADDEIEQHELETASDLLSLSVHRYCWLEQYEHFDPLRGANHVRDLLVTWQEDSSWLGGDVPGGAVSRPFNDLVLLACFVSDSSSLYQTYVKVSLLVAKIVLEVGGVESEEQRFYDEFAQSLHVTEDALISHCEIQNGSVSEGDSKQHGVLRDTEDELSPEESLMQGLHELQSLVGVDSVKSEVGRLMNFLKIRQQRIDQGMPVPKQSLHFVFTGNPGTGKTTVARIIAKILYGFEILETPKLVEADRSMMVGGYVGQTAIKTKDVISKATDGVLFIDEAYMLAKSDGQDYGQEAIDTLLKQMEDLRERLVVIVAGYPNEMRQFIGSNPGLESRFTRYIQFDDYHVSELCQIFEYMCREHEYELSQDARANLAILLNSAFTNRRENFGNARFVRNAYEMTIGNQSDRLAMIDSDLTKDMLRTIESTDLPYSLVESSNGPLDVSKSLWLGQCPKCQQVSGATVKQIGRVVKCGCGTRFRCPWWNLREKTVPGLVGFEKYERPMDLIGDEVVST